MFVIRTTACEAIGGLRVEALSGSLSCRRRSRRGKIGQLAEALFGESEIWTNQEKWVWTTTSQLSQDSRDFPQLGKNGFPRQVALVGYMVRP